jgi:hypothetical protein
MEPKILSIICGLSALTFLCIAENPSAWFSTRHHGQKRPLPQSDGEVIPLQHPQLQILVRIPQVPNPNSPLTPLFQSLLHRPAPITQPIGSFPDLGQLEPLALDTNSLDGDPSFILGSAGGDRLPVHPKDTGDVIQAILRVPVGLLECKVDVLGDLWGIGVVVITFGLGLRSSAFCGPFDGNPAGPLFPGDFPREGLKGAGEEGSDGIVYLGPFSLVSDDLFVDMIDV